MSVGPAIAGLQRRLHDGSEVPLSRHLLRWSCARQRVLWPAVVESSRREPERSPRAAWSKRKGQESDERLALSRMKGERVVVGR